MPLVWQEVSKNYYEQNKSHYDPYRKDNAEIINRKKRLHFENNKTEINKKCSKIVWLLDVFVEWAWHRDLYQGIKKREHHKNYEWMLSAERALKIIEKSFKQGWSMCVSLQ